MDHLSLLKSDIPQVQSIHDGGFADVLRAFAQSLGYTITNEPQENGLAQDVRGQIFFSDPPRIYIRDGLDSVSRAGVFAHELAHHFDAVCSRWYTMTKNGHHQEQLAEAVAVAILLDYNINRVELGRSYIKDFRTIFVDDTNNVTDEGWPVISGFKIPDFFDGALDNEFQTCYSAFSQALEGFLKGD